jgi:CheY-like chemotaxis protein
VKRRVRRADGAAVRGTPEAQGDAPRVLVVDDCADSREMYAEYLGMRGYDCDLAADGEQAVAFARAAAPDAIVMDLTMPVVDGRTAICTLRSDPRTRTIPIVIVTAQEGRVDRRRRARECGVEAFFTKPCMPHELAAALDEIVDVRKCG